MSSARDLLHSIGERVATSASVRNIYGEPITAHDRTLIPVARVGYGFGAGAGGGERGTGEPGTGERGAEDAAGSRSGGGGGGGGGATPVGVIEITPAGTRFIRFYEPRTIALMLGAGLFVGFIFGRLSSRS
ncbi:MAG: hypothetical protein JO022_09260 [Acidobacteriaceae bacterium]|nr:hypothetical protein [Acidobacteriaceae bacterium]